VNVVFPLLALSAVLYAIGAGFDPSTMTWSHLPMKAVGDSALSSAKGAVELAIGLVGYMALFLGLVEIVKEAGGLEFTARLVRPVLVRLFPDVPPDHPAMGAMVMNLAANMVGLTNAATPFGLKAMAELQTLNDRKDTATNAMCLFLAINTSGVAVLPTGMIALRASVGATDPASIFATTLAATAINSLFAIGVVKLLERLPGFRREGTTTYERPPLSLLELVPCAVAALGIVGIIALVYVFGEVASSAIVPLLIAAMLLLGIVRRVKVYEVFIRGAKDGFNVAILIIPYMVAILAAAGMFRASGALGAIVGVLSPLTERIGLPAEVLPVALLRPLSGSGAYALTADVLKTHGPDSYVGNLASTVNGSSETTLYVLAVYFGSIGVARTRHALPAGLLADLVGVLASVAAVRLLLF
jgi:spore maturation protein SpmA